MFWTSCLIRQNATDHIFIVSGLSFPLLILGVTQNVYFPAGSTTTTSGLQKVLNLEIGFSDVYNSEPWP